MKICVLGLDGAAPDVIFGDERLNNIRRLMDLGLFGGVESVIPPDPVPGWMCFGTSQDPGSLGLYGLRNRPDNSYNRPNCTDSSTIQAVALWDQLSHQDKKSILVGVPPNFPPRRINGASIGCFLTPDPSKDEFTYPASLKTHIQELVGDYPTDVKNFGSEDKDRLRDEIFAMSRKQWTVVKWLLKEQEWDYFHYVDIGLDRVQHGFWNFFDKQHRHYTDGNPYENVIPDYYLWLDQQVGEVLELLDNDTILLLVSPYGAQRLEGSIAVNQWLIEQALLVVDEYPRATTPFEELKVSWPKTRAWSKGGSYGRVFFNLQGREPQGVVPAPDYEAFQDELKAKLETMLDDKGKLLNSRVFKPKEIYRNLRKAAPDLTVQLGGSCWRSISSVGDASIYVQPNDQHPDGCANAPVGLFILAAPNCPLNGEHQGAHLLDMAPTLLDLAGYDIPESMQGRSLVAHMEKRSPLDGAGADAESDKIIHDRLAGLGYV